MTHGCTDASADLGLSCVNLAHIQAMFNLRGVGCMFSFFYFE